MMTVLSKAADEEYRALMGDMLDLVLAAASTQLGGPSARTLAGLASDEAFRARFITETSHTCYSRFAVYWALRPAPYSYITVPSSSAESARRGLAAIRQVYRVAEPVTIPCPERFSQCFAYCPAFLYRRAQHALALERRRLEFSSEIRRGALRFSALETPAPPPQLLLPEPNQHASTEPRTLLRLVDLANNPDMSSGMATSDTPTQIESFEFESGNLSPTTESGQRAEFPSQMCLRLSNMYVGSPKETPPSTPAQEKPGSTSKE